MQESLLRVYKKVGKTFELYWHTLVPPADNQEIGWYITALREPIDSITPNQLGIRTLYNKETHDRVRQGDIVCLRGEQCYIIDSRE